MTNFIKTILKIILGSFAAIAAAFVVFVIFVFVDAFTGAATSHVNGTSTSEIISEAPAVAETAPEADVIQEPVQEYESHITWSITEYGAIRSTNKASKPGNCLGFASRIVMLLEDQIDVNFKHPAITSNVGGVEKRKAKAKGVPGLAIVTSCYSTAIKG